MDTLKKNLQQREKTELITIIQHMLRQEPDLQWLLATPLPTALSRQASIDPQIYRQQVLAAMSAGDSQRQRKRHEVQRRLAAIKSIADEFAEHEDFAAALTIYEVLVTEVIEHFNDYRDEYVAFSKNVERRDGTCRDLSLRFNQPGHKGKQNLTKHA